MDWVAQFLADADCKEIEKLDKWFAADIELRFANYPAVKGKKEALLSLGQFYETIAGMRHTREDIIIDGNRASSQAIVTYTRHDGSAVDLPVASILRQTPAGQIDKLHIFIDMSPLYATN